MYILRSLFFVTIALFALGSISSVRAKDPLLDFETVIPGYYLASGNGMTVDEAGNTYVFGKYYADKVTLDVLVAKLDPTGTVLWLTTIEGDSHDYATDIIIDNANDVFITGWTDSSDFPIKNGLDGTLTGFRDAFVTKLSGLDGSILYSTFLGGDYTDEGQGIVLGAAGEIFIVGSTKSTDFPTTPDAFQGQPNAPLYIYKDVFITKLTAAGDAIVYSTYFGGFENDTAEEVALDSNGDIVIAGHTDAQDFPLVNPIVSAPRGLFVSKLSADGGTLRFSTYFGGEDLDRLGGMAIDSSGNVFIAGSTRSVTFPTTPGAYQEDFVGEINGCQIPFGGYYNCDDAFVTKMATDGTGLVYSTYLGGTRVEECNGIAVDDQGCAHVVGFTFSPDFPPDGIDFSAEIFVARFDPSGSVLDDSVTVNSGSANAGHGVAVDDAGGVYFTGAVNVPADIYVAKIASSDISLSISSTTTQVPQASSFLFDVQLANIGSEPRSFVVWTAAGRLPGGSIVEPLIGPAAFTLKPGEKRNASDVPQFVPGVPFGIYRYFLRAGQSFPGPLLSEDFVDFEVIP